MTSGTIWTGDNLHIMRGMNTASVDLIYLDPPFNSNGCGHHFQHRNLTIDHITPRDKGGTDHTFNLQLLCQACNSTKGNRTQAALKARLAELGITKETT